MSTFPGPSNPIVYAQFRLQGGWRGASVLAGVCAVILGGILVLNLVSAAGTGAPLAAVLSEWPQGLVILQVVLLLIIAPLRVVSAIHGDITSRMMESHRLMPVTSLGVMAGYVVGGPWAIVVLAATVFAFGSACCAISGGDPFPWLLANVTLAVAAACVWIVTAHLAMVARFGVLLLVVIAVLALSGNGGPGELLPGFTVISATLVTRSTLFLRGNGSHPEAWLCAAIAQLAIAAISGRAAVRLYRAPGTVGQSATLGLCLLAVWVVASTLGIGWSAVFRLRRSRDIDVSMQLVGSIVMGLLVAAMPIAASARTAVRGDPDGTASKWWRTSPVAVISCGLLVLLPAAIRGLLSSEAFFELPSPDRLTRATLLTPAVVLATTVGLAFLFRCVYARWERGWPSAIAWLVVTWVGPLLVDAAVNIASHETFGPVATLSPIGALSILWSRSDVDPTIGIALQFAAAAVPAIVWLTRRDRSADTGPQPRGFEVQLVDPVDGQPTASTGS
jgi:hypothetical protein